MKKRFMVYPKTIIPQSDTSIYIAKAPTKDKLKAFIRGYKEDYNELPSITLVQRTFHLSSEDAHMALVIYG